MPTLKTYDGHSLQVSDEEARTLAKIIAEGKQKSVIIAGNIIAISNISGVWNKSASEETDHTMGVLHDGTRVVKQFGSWFCIGQRNDQGHYEVRPDPAYYPEVAMDKVPSVSEYETKYAALPAEERKALMAAGYEPRRFNGQAKLESVGSILNP